MIKLTEGGLSGRAFSLTRRVRPLYLVFTMVKSLSAKTKPDSSDTTIITNQAKAAKMAS
jgi:hypothetical protein